MSTILNKLAAVLESRKGAAPESSYVAGLYAKGLDAILKKIGEEATETVIAAKGGDAGQVVHELADLWFHTLVLLAHQGLRPDDVLAELERRFGFIYPVRRQLAFDDLAEQAIAHGLPRNAFSSNPDKPKRRSSSASTSSGLSP